MAGSPSPPHLSRQPKLELPASASWFARQWQRFRPGRGIKFTREGKYFIGLAFGVGLAAINTANNLLYLLLGMLLSLIIVSGVMSELSLRGLTVVRRLPPRAQVGRPHLVEIEVYNHKSKLPSYAIEIEDLRAGQPADKRCFFLKISPHSAQVAAYRRTPARRGRDHHAGFRVATRFPFGLFEKSRELGARAELVIYPAVDPVRLPPNRYGRSQGGHTTLGRGSGDEILGLRPMREGEDPRDIYWKRSYGTQLVLRERASETRDNTHFTIDTTYPGSAPDADWCERFEVRIRDVASRVVAHLQRGDAVVVHSSAGERVRSHSGLGADPVLRFLALLQPTAAMRAREEPAPPAPSEPEQAA